MSDEKIAAFFDARTIGYSSWAKDGWYWRGPGYDEGWADLTPEEVKELYRLLRGES